MRDGVPSKRLLPAVAVFIGGIGTSLLAWQQTTLVIFEAGLFLTAVVTLLTFLVIVRGEALNRAHAQEVDHERRYRDLLRRADVGFSVSDFDGVILEANEPYAKILGISSPQDLVGRSLADFLTPEDRVRLRDHAAHKSYPTESASHVVKTVVQPGGRRRAVSVSTIVDHHNSQQRVIRLTQDITERLRAEQEILDGKRVFEDIFHNADVAILDVNIGALLDQIYALRAADTSDLAAYFDADPRRLPELCGRVRLNNINDAGLRLFGAQTADSLANIDFFLHGERPALVKAIALALWNGETTLRREAGFTTIDGRALTLIYSLTLPATLKSAERTPIVMIDVTDVRSAEVAQRANAAKSTFLASMSHEIRTPLNGVVGNLELLAQTEMRPDQESLLFDAEKAAKSLLALIGNILDFSKIEAGKLTVENVEINPALLVQESVDIVQSRARQKGIFVTASVSHDVPQVIKGDPTRIRQILLNLLGNAVKFTSAGGVHLTLRVTDDWDENICQLLFAVHDSGRGFRQSLASQLFQPFTHDYKQTANDFEGTGLGLSICKSLVESFGGEIGCESASDEGASFWFTLPTQVLIPAAPVEKPDLTGRSVIFIAAPAGDPPSEFRTYLADRHATIRTVATANDALAVARDAMAAGRHIDAAVYASAPKDWPDTAMSAALRDHQIVPIALAPEASFSLWRSALRSGAAYLVPSGIDVRFLDRNISQVFSDASQVQEQAAPVMMNGAAATLDGKHVLVLEDRLVNQTIVQRQLKKMGMSCVIAADGIAGLERLARGRFDLILCDCSMPRMNGYEFARNVRQREKESGAPPIPIIAMTANAFREDRDKCFAAGMNDFVSKPVTLPRLSSVLSHWLKAADVPAPPKPAAAAEHIASIEPVDIAQLEALLGGADRRIVLDIVKEFVSAAKESWEQVEGCAKLKDTGALTRMAHGAKGEARNAGAAHLGDLYEQLERSAKRNQVADIPALLDAIPVELTRVEVFVRNLLSEPAS